MPHPPGLVSLLPYDGIQIGLIVKLEPFGKQFEIYIKVFETVHPLDCNDLT